FPRRGAGFRHHHPAADRPDRPRTPAVLGAPGRPVVRGPGTGMKKTGPRPAGAPRPRPAFPARLPPSGGQAPTPVQPQPVAAPAGPARPAPAAPAASASAPAPARAMLA